MEKITRWCIELSCYSYDIVYCPGKENATANTFSQICGLISVSDTLQILHKDVCHPCIMKMPYFICCRNLPYSIDEIKKIIASCPIRSELKPRLFKPGPGNILMVTQPFERLNINFKGPLPSNMNNCYLLTVVNKYSRFPFAFALILM